MGGFKNVFKHLEQNAEKIMNGENIDDTTLQTFREEKLGDNYDVTLSHSTNPTRWEKAVVALNGMVQQVSKVDPDGLDIVCFGGDANPDAKSPSKSKISVYRNVKNHKEIEDMVTSKLPAGLCHMGKAMDFVLQEAFDRGFKKRPCGILVLTAGCPDDAKKLEQSLQRAAETIARGGYKESPLSVTFVHVGDDEKAEEYMQHLANDMASHKKSKKTGEVVDIVDTIKDRDIQAAMKEIKGTKSTGTTGAIIGAFAGAAMGIGGMRLYNKNQAKKRTIGWNGTWTASYDSCTIATLTIKDDLKGKLEITGFDGGRTTGRYVENKNGYTITFRDADEHWLITGDIEDEHTISWTDGTRWNEVPPKGGNWKQYAGAAVAGAATGGAVGYLLDKNFFKKASKKDQADYVILVDRSAMMAIQDKSRADDDDEIEEYQPSRRGSTRRGSGGNFLENTTQKFNNLSTGQKVAVGVAGVATVGGVAAAGVGIAKAVKSKNSDAPVATARAISVDDYDDYDDQGRRKPTKPKGGINGNWRSTFDGDEIAMLDVTDTLDGLITIDGFFGTKTIGRYARNSVHRITKIHFIDPDENWAVTGEVKGSKEQVIVWSDGTRWDKIS